MNTNGNLGRGIRAVALLVILALSVVAPAVQAKQQTTAGPDLFSITNPMPASDSIVPAGDRTIGAEIFGQNIANATIILNSEVLSLTQVGDNQRQRVMANRILAPGEYTVVVTANDASLGQRSVSWRFRVEATNPQLPVPEGFTQVDAKIQIVFPHEGAPVAEADLANISALLFTPGTRLPVPCAFNRPVRLWQAVNSDPAEPVALGERVTRNVEGRTFPAWEFNDVDVSAANDPNSKIFFFVTVDGMGTNSNVWIHGADPRTIFPFQDVPAAVVDWGEEVDAKIEIVYPHGGAPVSQAIKANIGTDVFVHDTLHSVNDSADPYLHLIRAANAEVATYGGTGTRIIVKGDGPDRPRWVFNDVDVSTANNPENVILFHSIVGGVTTFPNVWAHGADVRTFFPEQDVPSQSCQGPLP